MVIACLYSVTGRVFGSICVPRKSLVLRSINLKRQKETNAVMDIALLTLMLMVTGAIAGLCSGLFGVGGGFIVVPALLFVLDTAGYGGEGIIFIAIGTSLATIILASSRSALSHWRLGSLDVQFVRNWLPWLTAGTLIGVVAAAMVSSRQLQLIFALGVGAYSFFFLFPRAFSRFEFENLPVGMTRAVLGTSVGGVSALLGIGGGTPIVITMTLCGRPIVQAVGTAAGVGVIIGMLGAVGFLIVGLSKVVVGAPPGSIGFINIPALIAISAVSVMTAPYGARLAHDLKSDSLKRYFGLYLLVVATIILQQTTVT